MTKSSLSIAAAAFATVTCLTASTAQACPYCKSPFKPGTYIGEAQRVGNGIAYSWVTLDDKGKPSAIGVTITDTALEGLSDSAALIDMKRSMFPLELPKEAEKAAFRQISLDWNAHGHPPTGIYDKPHFDVHFYMVDMAAREKITAAGKDVAVCQKGVGAKFVPAGYIYAKGTEVPMMGGHWINPKFPELSGKSFTSSFLYGSYNGQMTFMEPMVTREFLLTHPEVSETIDLPASYAKSAYYPTKYHIHSDPVRHEITISLEGMAWREAPSEPKLKAVKTASK